MKRKGLWIFKGGSQFIHERPSYLGLFLLKKLIKRNIKVNLLLIDNLLYILVSIVLI